MTGARATDEETPADLGFAMPAEWEHHEATWLGWPQNAADWPGSSIRGTVEGVRELDLGAA